MHKDNLRAWEICWRGLGAKRGESIHDAAKRARYHGHERAAASEALLAIQDDWTPEQKWGEIRNAAAILKVRLVRGEP